MQDWLKIGKIGLRIIPLINSLHVVSVASITSRVYTAEDVSAEYGFKILFRWDTPGSRTYAGV